MIRITCRRFAAVFLFFATGCLFTLPFQSFADTQRDIRFSKELNELGFYNYSVYFLTKKIESTPQDIEKLYIQLAETYVRQNNADEALKTIEKIPAASPDYTRGQAVLGTYLVNANKLKEAIVPLRKVFEYCKANPDAPNELKDSIRYLLYAYKTLGMAAEAEEVQSIVFDELSDREKKYTKAVFDLDSAGALKAAEEKSGLTALKVSFDNALSGVLAKSTDKAQAGALENQKKNIYQFFNKINGATPSEKPALAKNLRDAKDSFLKAVTDMQSKVEDAELNNVLNTEKNKLNTFVNTFAAQADKLALFANRNALKGDQAKSLRNVDAKDWRSIVFNAVFDLEDVQWGGIDGLYANACIQMARAFVMLGLYDEALQELAKNKEIFQSYDEAYAAENRISESPGADAKFWEAKAYYSKYQADPENEESIRFLRGAFVNYGRLLKNYVGYHDADAAYGEFMQISDELVKKSPDLQQTVEAEKKKVPVPGGAASGSIVTENLVSSAAEQNYELKRYSDVINELLPVLRKKRTSSGLPPLLEKLTVSFAAVPDRNFEAMALAALMRDQYPRSKYTSSALLLAGTALWDKNTLQDKNDAITVYEMFLKVDISNQVACDVATRVAQEYYNRAVTMGNEANKLPADSAEKQKINQEVFALFRNAIVNFQRVVDNFSFNKPRVENAYLYMARSYESMNQFLEAARTYQFYCDTHPDNKINRISAKLSVASNLYKAATNLEKEAKLVREAAYSVQGKAEMPEKATDKGAAEAKEGEVAAADTEKAAPEITEEATEVLATGGGDDIVGENVVVHDINTREGRLIMSDRMTEEAKELYGEAVNALHELLTQWLGPGGEYAGVANDPMVAKVKEDAISLLPWLQDGYGNKKQAAVDFSDFIAAYPKNKDVPKSMMRLGVIYTEIGENDKATEVLDRLSVEYKDTPEGKNARFYLARSLYSNNHFEKSIKLFQDILSNKELTENLNIQNLRWIASNLYTGGAQQFPEGAQVSLEAAELLLKKLENPVLVDWVGGEKAAELANNPSETARTMMMLKEKVLLDAGLSSYRLGETEKALKYLDEVVATNQNSPYFYDVYFARANIYIEQKKYEDARKDLGQVALRSNSSGRFTNYYKAQCLIGDTYMEEENYLRAFTAFNLVAAPSFNGDDDTNPAFTEEEKTALETEKAASREWQEYAIYKAAYCAALLGRPEKAALVEKYKKNFVGGRFEKEINELPQPLASKE